MFKIYKAFTLVEMLIVMGIIIILMAVGIASGRYALRRANNIEHENSAENIYEGLQAYYADNREYPEDQPVSVLVGITLGAYMENFDGGSEATYFYDSDDLQQTFVVCVTLGGINDRSQLGIYCTGIGIGAIDESGLVSISSKYLDYDSTDYQTVLVALEGGDGDGGGGDWNPPDGGDDDGGFSYIDPIGPITY